MTEGYIAIGSNVKPEENIPAALRRLRDEVRLEAVSTFYRTRPIASLLAPDFYNGAARIEADADARELKFRVLRGIEKELGRVRAHDRNAPRTIDLDLVLFGDLVVNEDGLMVPDPDIMMRAFIAVPLLELAPDLMLPGAGMKLRDAAAALSAEDLEPLDEFTRRIKEEFNHGP